jgi:hypothetical protein
MTWQPELSLDGGPAGWDYPAGSKTKAQRLAALEYATNVAEADQAEERNSKPTQANRILAHLRAGNRLTALDALERFGCFRLAARIHELRREGWAIEERTVETRGGKRVAEYWL